MTNVMKLKFAEDVLDYAFDWTAFLDGNDTIATATVTATPTGLTITHVSIDAFHTVVSALIAGGVVGLVYQVRCEIVTVGGLTANSATALIINENAR